MGSSPPKMCQMKEIAFEPSREEWRPVDEWSEDIDGTGPCDGVPVPQHCRLCCRPGDSQVEEVLVVHHEALQKVDFLLRHDELTSCEAPMIPECVAAVRRAKIQKRLQARLRPQSPSPLNLVGQPAGDDGDDDPSDEEIEASMLNDFVENPQASRGRPEHGVESRMEGQGLKMWLLRRGKEGKLKREDVLLRLLAPELSAVRVVGESTDLRFSLAQILCVELLNNAGDAAHPVDALVARPCERESATEAFAADALSCASSSEAGRLLPEPELTPEASTEQEIHIYITASVHPERKSDGVHSFAFQVPQDAQEFAKWMRFYYKAQVVHAGAVAQFVEKAD